MPSLPSLCLVRSLGPSHEEEVTRENRKKEEKKKGERKRGWLNSLSAADPHWTCISTSAGGGGMKKKKKKKSGKEEPARCSNPLIGAPRCG